MALSGRVQVPVAPRDPAQPGEGHVLLRGVPEAAAEAPPRPPLLRPGDRGLQEGRRRARMPREVQHAGKRANSLLIKQQLQRSQFSVN